MADDSSNSGMELQTFITETLRSIISGVADAQHAIDGQGHNAVVVPIYGAQTHAPADPVEFDIAISVSVETGLKGESKLRLKVPVLQIGLGVEGSDVERSSSTSRVKFKVPVSLPSTEAPQSKPLPKRKPPTVV
jgi:hypothetical protein